MAVAWRWVAFSKGKKTTCQKCRREKLLTVHTKQIILSLVYQCAGQGIFKLLLGTKHLGNLVPHTFLSFYLVESEAKEQQS